MTPEGPRPGPGHAIPFAASRGRDPSRRHGGDSYNKSLRDAFTEARGAGSGAQDMTFASEGPEIAGVTPNEFETFALNLCESKARVVYFAGRAFHLDLFVKKLARTYCARKQSYTVRGAGAPRRLGRGTRALEEARGREGDGRQKLPC